LDEGLGLKQGVAGVVVSLHAKGVATASVIAGVIVEATRDAV